MAYQNILVAVDGSPTSNLAVAHAASLASATRARVRLLHVLDPAAHISGFERPETYIQDVLPHLYKAGQALLDEARGCVLAQGVAADTALVENLNARVAELVVEHAQAWGADLIVLGTHGRRGLARMLMGSDAEQVARTAPVPVLLVRQAAGGDCAVAQASAAPATA